MKPLFIIAIVLISMSGAAQNIAIDNIRWQASTLLDTSTKESMVIDCAFITYASQGKITWNQKNGGYVSDFKILSTQGSWTDVSQPGQVEYAVQYEGKNGTLWIGKEGDKIEVRLTFDEGGKNKMPYTFSIVSLAKI